jgi:hypothetical protein
VGSFNDSQRPWMPGSISASAIPFSSNKRCLYPRDAAFLYKTHFFHFYTQIYPVYSSKRIQQEQLH